MTTEGNHEMPLCQGCGKEFEREEEGQTICENCPGDSLDFDDGVPRSSLPERVRLLGRDDVLEQSQVRSQLRGMLFPEPAADGDPDPNFLVDTVY